MTEKEEKEKEEMNMLDAILDFYKFRILQSSSCMIETCDQKYVGLKTTSNNKIYLFASRHDVLKMIIGYVKSFAYGIHCSKPDIPNIFRGCKSLEEIQIQIDLHKV